jgi:hypothetical protein
MTRVWVSSSPPAAAEAVTLLERVVDRLNAAQQRLEADRAWR